MLKVTIKGLLARKRRLFTTALAVMLGVAFMAGTLVLTDTIGKTFDDLFADVNAGIDAVVREEAAFSDQFAGDQRGLIDESLVATVAEAPGVATAEAAVFGFAQIIGKDGEPIGNPGNGAPTFGTNWSSNPDLAAFTLESGDPPGPDEVVIDKASAELGGYVVGDEVSIATLGGQRTFGLSGIATFGETDNAAGASTSLFDLATAQEVLGTPGQVNEIYAVADDGISQEQLVADIVPVLPQEGDRPLEVITGDAYTEDQQSQIRDALGAFNVILIVFALIALFVGTFIIYNTFSIIVAQRGREMALLRAVGASRGQVLSSILIEAMIVGLIASVIGLVAGIGLAELLKAGFAAGGFDIPATGSVILPRTVIVSFVVGLGVTIGSALAPAVRGSRIPPIAALRDVSTDESGSSATRLVVGLLITALGMGLIMLGLFGGGSGAPYAVGFGAFFTFIGVFVLGPRIAVPVTKVLGGPLPHLRGVSGRLAKENALRNPKRTAATASALMIGIGLVALIAILAQSVKTSAFASIDDSFTGDLAIDSGTFGFGGLPPQLATELQDEPDLAAVSPLRLGFAEIGPSTKLIQAVDPVPMFQIVDVGLVEGSAEALAEEGTIAVEISAAESVGWGIGSQVPVTFAKTGEQNLEIVALYENDDAIRADASTQYIVGLATADANFDQLADFQVYVECADDVTIDECRSTVEDVAEGYPQATVQNLDELKQAQADQVNQLLALFYVLLFLAIVIAVLGIMNTLALSIFERTREIGLLRAVGATRNQVRSAVRWEAVIIALLGTALGLAIGLFFSFSLQRALVDEGINQFDIPWLQVVVIVVLGAIVGLLSSIWPAIKASRLQVLESIAIE